MRRKKPVAAVAAVVAGIMLLTACQNLPRRTAGARCTTVGEHAKDATWVLKCGTNKRWNRLMTIAAANNAVADWLRSQAPAAPPTTAPPTRPPATLPPTTTPPVPPSGMFESADNALVSTDPGGIPPGHYATTVPNGWACLIEVTGGPTVRTRGGHGGPLYINLYAGMRVTTVGPCMWSLQDRPPQTMPANGDGMYRTGIEIQPGVYTAPGGTQCYWETAVNADGSLESITDIYYGPGPQLAVIESGDRYFTSDGCGAWTLLPSPPTRFLNVASSLDNNVFRGLRAFYQGTQFTSSPYAPQVYFTTPQFAFTLGRMLDTPFAEGTFDIAAQSDATHLRVYLNGAGRGCQEVTGTASISDLVLDADGAPTTMHVVVLGECDGQRFGIDTRF